MSVVQDTPVALWPPAEEVLAQNHLAQAEDGTARAVAAAEAAGADISRAVVVGGGNMGAGISYALARTGIHVTLVEASENAAQRARANIGALYRQAVARGKMTSETADQEQADQFSFVVGTTALPPADIAIEAVFEDLAVKRDIFSALEKAQPETAILATNTSYLDVNLVADGLRSQERVIGLHFFSPAHVMKLLEVVKARNTSPATLATAFRLAGRLGKIPVQAGVCDGFIGNRILTRYRQTTDVMLVEGALPAQVDAAMKRFGMAMGPYAVQDLSGLDIAYANRQRKGLKHGRDIRYIPIADRMVEDLRRLGRKTGTGWYDYSEGQEPAPAAVVERLVLDVSRELGVVRRSFTDEEIAARAVLSMIDEGFGILEEGIARCPADIDLVMVHGYAYPRRRGGPMFEADTLGLPKVLGALRALAQDDPQSWRIPPLLDQLVRDGSDLRSLNHRRDIA